MSVGEPQGDFQRRGDFFFLERLVAEVHPQIFVSRTLEKLGRTYDQIGHTLEP